MGISLQSMLLAEVREENLNQKSRTAELPRHINFTLFYDLYVEKKMRHLYIKEKAF